MRKADEIEQLALETLSKHQMVTPGQKYWSAYQEVQTPSPFCTSCTKTVKHSK